MPRSLNARSWLRDRLHHPAPACRDSHKEDQPENRSNEKDTNQYDPDILEPHFPPSLYLKGSRTTWESFSSSGSSSSTPAFSSLINAIRGCISGKSKNKMNSGSFRGPPIKRRVGANNVGALYDACKKKMLPNGEDQNDRFVPDSDLRELFCEKTVLSTLKNCQLSKETDIKLLARFVCNKARKTFAILAMMAAEKHIEQFYKCQFTDDNLPIEIKVEEGPNDEQYIYVWSIDTNHPGKLAPLDWQKHPFYEDPWSTRTYDEFCNTWQWSFVCPVFRLATFEYNFHERIRLPFVDKGPASFHTSNFSDVEERRIHCDHLQCEEKDMMNLPVDDDGHYLVAVKRLKTNVLRNLPNVKLEDVIEAEIQSLKTLKAMKHPHLIRAIAYYVKGGDHHIVFPWAGGGNLKNLWGTKQPRLDPLYLEWFFSQIRGLSDAIQRLHHPGAGSAPASAVRPESSSSLRHGDLKPENILLFENRKESQERRKTHWILQITDVGLAKSHKQATELRDATRAFAGTIMYEPPEATEKGTARSRRYDVWSMGCIYLEFLIWLLYGAEGLDRFGQDIREQGSKATFYDIDDKSSLNTAVQTWIDHIYTEDQRCSEGSALRRLLDVIVSGLLVPYLGKTTKKGGSPELSRVSTLKDAENVSQNGELPTFSFRPPTALGEQPNAIPQRWYAYKMCSEIQQIYNDATRKHNPVAWMNFDASAKEVPKKLLAPHSTTHQNRQNTPLDNKWQYTADTPSADRLFKDPDFRAGLPGIAKTSRFCDRCKDLQLHLPTCITSDTRANLRQKSQRCDLCHLFLLCTDNQGLRDFENIQFSRVGSGLRSSHAPNQPIISLYKQPGNSLQIRSDDIAVGLPKLPTAGGVSHIKILSEWIHRCDESHKCMTKVEFRLPTRVVDVGEKGSSTIRLFCDTAGKTGKYIALSHRWGPPSDSKKFSTTTENIEKHIKGVPVSELPKTFQNAVHITRCLGIQYLWIDSLCIIQGDDKDWEKESKRMEKVYSSAYATISASCASGMDDGFLKPRTDRECVTKIDSVTGSTVYLCRAIDDFKNDVEKGDINKRGWVLQERALSRRTMYFAHNQTYWECGEGVRCETLNKMINARSSFLGDSNFPYSLAGTQYVKGKKIALWQGLYEQYSSMDLTYPADRPVAIRGLEKRLIRALETVGGYGVFEKFLHRGLLWERDDSGLKRIDFSNDRYKSTPSWSWMAYDGAIKYMEVPGGEVDWADDIISPFKTGNVETGTDSQAHLEIEAQVHDIVEGDAVRLYFDEQTRSPDQLTKCVIVGLKDGLNYVLLVASLEGGPVGVYQRVGVGILNDSQIVLDQWGAKARIR